MNEESSNQPPAASIEEINVIRPEVDAAANLEQQDLQNRRDWEKQHQDFKHAIRKQSLNFRRVLFYGAAGSVSLFYFLSLRVAYLKFDAIGINHNYLILVALPAFIGTLIALALVRNVFGSQEQKDDRTEPTVLLEFTKELNKLKS
jgi:hypothetical protein